MRWMSLVAMKTWRCGRSATRIASTARCGSPSRQRASAATAIPPFVSWAIRRTASKSPGEAAGKPASITSTLSRASWRATSSFSAAVSPAPGACSPSRSVVSKIRTLPGGDRRAAHRAGACAAGAGGRGCRRPDRRLGLAGLDDDRVEERHLGPQVAPDLLDLVVLVLLRGAARTPPRRPPARRSSGSRTSRSGCRARTSFIVAFDALGDPRAGDVVAVLGGVADAEAHEVQAAAVHQVDDQLQLVHRLEVGELGLVAGLDERLERRLDQGRDAAAQERLLAEQVGLGLLLERRLEDAGAGRADPAGVGEHASAGGPGRVVLDGEQGRDAAACLVDASGGGGPGPSARPSRRRSSSGGLIRPNRMLKPWANIRSWPGRRFGSISAS